MLKRNKIILSSLIIGGFSSLAYAKDEVLVCLACPVGTYSDGTTTSCTPCPANTHVNSSGSACVSCLTTGVASCDSLTGKPTGCKAGYGYNSTNKTCTLCAKGTYSAGGKSTCQPCATATTTQQYNCGTQNVTITTYCTTTGNTSSKSNPTTKTESKTISCPSGKICIGHQCKNIETTYVKCCKSKSDNSVICPSSYTIKTGDKLPSCSSGTYLFHTPTGSTPGYSSVTSCGDPPGASTYKLCKAIRGLTHWCGTASGFQPYDCKTP